MLPYFYYYFDNIFLTDFKIEKVCYKNSHKIYSKL